MYAVTTFNGVSVHRYESISTSNKAGEDKLSVAIAQMHAECNKFFTMKCLENASQGDVAKTAVLKNKRVKRDDDRNDEFFDEVSE